MKYRRINNDTVQCIVTSSDMEQYGLTMSDLFERSERAESFLRELLEEAHQEVGYEFKGNNIAIQITPMKDDGMIITIAEDNGSYFKGFLEHMKDVVGALADSELDVDDFAELMAQINSAGTPKQQEKIAPKEEKTISSSEPEQPEDIRIFEFDSIGDVFEFVADGFGTGQVKSYFGKADEKYYLVVIKNRMSWVNFNKMSAKAFEFGRIVVDVRGKLVYLSEHGEGLIENGAIRKLAKISQGK